MGAVKPSSRLGEQKAIVQLDIGATPRKTGSQSEPVSWGKRFEFLKDFK